MPTLSFIGKTTKVCRSWERCYNADFKCAGRWLHFVAIKGPCIDRKSISTIWYPGITEIFPTFWIDVSSPSVTVVIKAPTVYVGAGGVACDVVTTAVVLYFFSPSGSQRWRHFPEIPLSALSQRPERRQIISPRKINKGIKVSPVSSRDRNFGCISQ